MAEIAENGKVEQVNVRKIFHNKNPKLARLLPGFFFRYLEKIVHQEEINEILRKYGGKYGLEFVNLNIADFKVTSEIIGEENLPPKNGRYIFASNHPLGGFDGLLLLSSLSRYYDDVKFMVNDILMNLKNLEPLFIAINKHGGQSKGSVLQLDETYKSNTQLLTFPAGMVSRRKKGKIIDPEWYKNFIAKSVQYQRDVVPVHISGRNTNFFYRLHSFRSFFGIKLNLEMLYLADETFKHKNKHIKITIGKPIPYTTFDKSKTYKDWAYEVKKIVYGLGNYPL